jgi:hypothetical protein
MKEHLHGAAHLAEKEHFSGEKFVVFAQINKLPLIIKTLVPCALLSVSAAR